MTLYLIRNTSLFFSWQVFLVTTSITGYLRYSKSNSCFIYNLVEMTQNVTSEFSKLIFFSVAKYKVICSSQILINFLHIFVLLKHYEVKVLKSTSLKTQT